MAINWLITGGCGFIGSNLVASLLEEKSNRIRVLDNELVGSRVDLGRVAEFELLDVASLTGGFHGQVQLCVGDILSENFVRTVMSGVDVVVHLAANTGVQPSLKDPHLDARVNIIGSLNLLTAARDEGVRRFVFASSGAVVGTQDPPIYEEVLPKPISPYGASKLSGEAYCHTFFSAFGLDTVCLRFSNVYGPGSYLKESVIAKFIKKVVRRETIEIVGDGTQTRDFIYVQDLCRAIQFVSVGDQKIGGEVFQVATGRGTNLNDLLVEIKRAAGIHGLTMPEVRYVAERVGDMKYNFADIGKISRMTGWAPAIGLREGLEKTVGWYKEFYSH